MQRAANSTCGAVAGPGAGYGNGARSHRRRRILVRQRLVQAGRPVGNHRQLGSEPGPVVRGSTTHWTDADEQFDEAVESHRILVEPRRLATVVAELRALDRLDDIAPPDSEDAGTISLRDGRRMETTAEQRLRVERSHPLSMTPGRGFCLHSVRTPNTPRSGAFMGTSKDLASSSKECGVALPSSETSRESCENG